MNIAVIDVGTNTVLLLVAHFDNHGRLTPVLHEQRIPRLGRGVDARGVLQRESMDRVLDVLKEYRSVLSSMDIAATVVCGTSAVRDAQNRKLLADQMRTATGFELEVLSGSDEAAWTFRGAIRGMPEGRDAVVVDIGGGSTELISGSDAKIAQSVSLPLGSVRLTERHFLHDPPMSAEIEEAVSTISRELSASGIALSRGSTLIGVAGTATTLALLAQGLSEFSVEAVAGYKLSLDSVDGLFRKLSAMSSENILRLSNAMPGRNDIITAGTLILREVMKHLGFGEVAVSERGVRYGIAIREWEKRRKG